MAASINGNGLLTRNWTAYRARETEVIEASREAGQSAMPPRH